MQGRFQGLPKPPGRNRMSDKGEKPLNHASETAPEPDGLGTPDRLPDPVQKKLARLCGRFVTRLRRDRELAEAARGDPATFRAALVKVVRSLFPVQRGRPTD